MLHSNQSATCQGLVLVCTLEQHPCRASCSAVSNSLWLHGLYSSWNSPGQNTGVGTLSLLWGIFPTHGSNPDLPCSRWILYQLSHRGSPRILEWGAYAFSRGSSQPKNRTGVSRIAGRFFTKWAMHTNAPQTLRLWFGHHYSNSMLVHAGLWTPCSTDPTQWITPGQSNAPAWHRLEHSVCATGALTRGWVTCHCVVYIHTQGSESVITYFMPVWGTPAEVRNTVWVKTPHWEIQASTVAAESSKTVSNPQGYQLSRTACILQLKRPKATFRMVTVLSYWFQISKSIFVLPNWFQDNKMI